MIPFYGEIFPVPRILKKVMMSHEKLRSMPEGHNKLDCRLLGRIVTYQT